MSLNGLPQAQGLYDPAYEHDACRPLTGPCAIAVLGFLRLVRVGAPAGYEDPIRLV